MNYPLKKVEDLLFGKCVLVFPLPKKENGQWLWFSWGIGYGWRII